MGVPDDAPNYKKESTQYVYAYVRSAHSFSASPVDSSSPVLFYLVWMGGRQIPSLGTPKEKKIA